MTGDPLFFDGVDWGIASILLASLGQGVPMPRNPK